LILAIFGAFGYLIFNLYHLQISKQDYYSNQAAAQYRLAGFLEPHRGVIYFTDKGGNAIPAALNRSYPVIFAVPRKIDDLEETVGTIAPILSLREEELRSTLADRRSLYRLLAKKASANEFTKIKQADLPGIYVDEQELRFYPLGKLAAHLLGFVGPSENGGGLVGRYGLERLFSESLGGVPGRVDDNRMIEPIQGEDLTLTIDRNIQGRAEEILEKLVNQYQAKGGTVIVLQPRTGSILALGNYRNFDPNDYSKFDIYSFLNPAVQAIYEPGSVFKVITMAIALDLKKISPQTTYYDTGEIHLNGKVIKNWDLKSYGQTTMTEVIEKSINTGSAFAARLVGGNSFYDYLVKFGLKEKTGVQLPDEIVGNIENVRKPREINLATASFGQGISVTPLSLISAVAAIANKGVLMRPNLIKDQAPQVVRRVVSQEAAGQITAMMVSAVDKAQVARIANYRVAGKTGTAQVPNFQTGGYTEEVINTYIGFAPATDPQFVALIKIDQPPGAPLAGLTVVPAFRELAQFILNYYNAAPDNLSQ